MNVNGQFHVPAALPPEKQPSVIIGQETYAWGKGGSEVEVS